MSQQVDPAAAVHMAQQEMEYRVDLFNKYVYISGFRSNLVLFVLLSRHLLFV